MSEIIIRPVEDTDRTWVKTFIEDRWGSEIVISRATVYEPHRLPGFIAYADGESRGLVTYHLRGNQCEIITIDTTVNNKGVGTMLLTRVFDEAHLKKWARVWLITTNDNINAIAFYQKRGMHIAAIHSNAMQESRRIKSKIPLIAENGIPIRDEIEFEYIVK
jgi:N-acetylglutamate synthase-like GNAT family acetyltransferase